MVLLKPARKFANRGSHLVFLKGVRNLVVRCSLTVLLKAVRKFTNRSSHLVFLKAIKNYRRKYRKYRRITCIG